RQFGDADFPGKSKFLQRPDAVPVDVYFVPGQPLARRRRMRMMVVVPAFPPTYQRHPPVIARIVGRLEAATAPGVRGRVYKKSRVPGVDDSQADPPQDELPAPGPIQDSEQNKRRNEVPS